MQKVEAALNQVQQLYQRLFHPHINYSDYSINASPEQDIIVTFYHPPFTTTRILLGSEDFVVEGQSKCNASDKYNKEIGQRISCARAVRKWVDQNEAMWIARSRTIEQVEAQRAAKKKHHEE